jgi:DeoR/GlpR family transcriptional regulator of sugar metabolism
MPADTFGPARTVDLPLDDRKQENRSAKEAIAVAAVSLLRDGDAVVIDAGSTTELMAPHLAMRDQLTVVTTSLPLAWALRGKPNIELIVVGGLLQPKGGSLVGMLAEQTLSQVYADIAFVAARGLTLAEGLTNPRLDEVPVKRRMIAIAKRSVALIDSSKWGCVFLGRIAPVSDLRTIITDAKAPSAMRREIELAGTEVILADGDR